MKWRFIYRGLKARYWSQRYEIEALIRHTKPGQIAVDVGANKGSYLWSLSRAVSMGKVIAFEPQPILASYLEQACKEAGLKNVKIFNKGVSDKSGVFSLAIPGGNDTSPGASFEEAVKNREHCKFINVPTVTLDEFFYNETGDIASLKVDVEGHELAVLRGASELLRHHRPIVVCESEQRHLSTGKVEDLFSFMHALGYSGFFIHRGEKIPVSEFIGEIHQKQIGERYWDSKDYCNNFFFTPLK